MQIRKCLPLFVEICLLLSSEILQFRNTFTYERGI